MTSSESSREYRARGTLRVESEDEAVVEDEGASLLLRSMYVQLTRQRSAFSSSSRRPAPPKSDKLCRFFQRTGARHSCSPWDLLRT